LSEKPNLTISDFADRVGTGFSEKLLASIDAQLQKLRISTIKTGRFRSSLKSGRGLIGDDLDIESQQLIAQRYAQRSESKGLLQWFLGAKSVL
jgi:ATP-dependent DNA ligase